MDFPAIDAGGLLQGHGSGSTTARTQERWARCVACGAGAVLLGNKLRLSSALEVVRAQVGAKRSPDAVRSHASEDSPLLYRCILGPEVLLLCLTRRMLLSKLRACR